MNSNKTKGLNHNVRDSKAQSWLTFDLIVLFLPHGVRYSFDLSFDFFFELEDITTTNTAIPTATIPPTTATLIFYSSFAAFDKRIITLFRNLRYI